MMMTLLTTTIPTMLTMEVEVPSRPLPPRRRRLPSPAQR
jgi:hypothetical protein